MRATRTIRRAASVAGLLAVTSGLAGWSATPAVPIAVAAEDEPARPTVEEMRLDRPIPGRPGPMAAQIVEQAGFTPLVDDFARDLRRTHGPGKVDRLVRRYGEHLWRAAVRRAQGPADTRPGALPVDDDRPLYWARLTLTRTLRQWQPSFPATAAQQAAWQKRLEYTSRGLTTSRFAVRPGVRRLFVSGFDPFGLDTEIRTGNPSGASALQLDGRTFTTDGVRVQVQAVLLPVRYADFDQGLVEAAFGPHLRPGRQRADLVSTTSQGRLGRFDLEVFNGRRRSTTYPDNQNEAGGGTATRPVVFPGVGPGAEFIRSTLPLGPMQAAGSAGPFPVIVHTGVVEIPLGATAPVTRPDGPTEGSTAVEGGGGSYLSNESAYRVTRLLTTVATPPPGGHVHVPVMSFGPDNTDEITDPVFESNRAAIVAETRSILLAGVKAVR